MKSMTVVGYLRDYPLFLLILIQHVYQDYKTLLKMIKKDI